MNEILTVNFNILGEIIDIADFKRFAKNVGIVQWAYSMGLQRV